MSDPTIRECPTCPTYMAQCWHVGSAVVWMTTGQRNKLERIKRGMILLPNGRIECPGCGEVQPLLHFKFAVLGPGVVETPTCPCRYGLTIPRNKAYLVALFDTEADAIAEGERRIRELT